MVVTLSRASALTFLKIFVAYCKQSLLINAFWSKEAFLVSLSPAECSGWSVSRIVESLNDSLAFRIYRTIVNMLS
jgi:hypothetical protein